MGAKGGQRTWVFLALVEVRNAVTPNFSIRQTPRGTAYVCGAGRARKPEFLGRFCDMPNFSFRQLSWGSVNFCLRLSLNSDNAPFGGPESEDTVAFSSLNCSSMCCFGRFRFCRVPPASVGPRGLP